MLTHVLGQDTETDTGKVVDGEPGVTWVVHREDSSKAGPEDLICHPLPQLRQAKMFAQNLEKNLDEDTTARCCFILVHVDDGHDVPPKRVSAEQMPKEAGNVAQSIRLVSVNRIVVFGECRLKQVGPQTIDFSEPFSNQSVELGVCAFLRAALNDHGWKLVLQARR